MGRLDILANAALKKHDGNVEKALPEFKRAVIKQIDAWARPYLRAVVVESGPSPTIIEAQENRAGSTPPVPVKGSVEVRPYDVPMHRRRTQAEKDAATRAMLASAEAVFDLQIDGRAIGNIAIGELASLKHHLVDDASQMLMLGAEKVRNAILAELVEQHCTVPDQLVRIRDAVSAKTLARLVERADQETPHRISEWTQRAAEVFDHTRTREIGP